MHILSGLPLLGSGWEVVGPSMGNVEPVVLHHPLGN